MPVLATRLERKMRGGAQAHLLAGADGSFYVTKFRENPQHRRILVNEWIAGSLLRYLQVAAPRTRVVEVSAEFLQSNVDVYLQCGNSQIAVGAGWHFGSEFPGNPYKEAVYDYLPDTLLAQVANLGHFLGALVFDKWTGNTDSRQAIFFRRRLRDWLDDEPSSSRKGFVTQMVDHGFLFDGPNWAFPDTPLQGLYLRELVYRNVQGFEDLQPWFDRARNCPGSILEESLETMPREWLPAEEEDRIASVLETLLHRRKHIERLIQATVRARPSWFPAWKHN